MLLNLINLLIYQTISHEFEDASLKLSTALINKNITPELMNALKLFDIEIPANYNKLSSSTKSPQQETFEKDNFKKALLENLPNLFTKRIEEKKLKNLGTAIYSFLEVNDIKIKKQLFAILQDKNAPHVNRKIAAGWLIQIKNKENPEKFAEQLLNTDNIDYHEGLTKNIYDYIRNSLYDPTDIILSLVLAEVFYELKITIDINVEHYPHNLWALQTYLIFERNSSEAKKALSFLITNTNRDSLSTTYLKLLIEQDNEATKEIEISENSILSPRQKANLENIKTLFSLDNDSSDFILLDIYSNFLMEYCEKYGALQINLVKILTEKFILKLNNLPQSTLLANRIAQLLLNLHLKTSLINSKNEQLKRNILISWSEYMQDKPNPNFPRYEDYQKSALETIKNSLESKNKVIAVYARDICLLLKIKLNLNQMFNLAVDGLQINPQQNDECILFIGSTGSGKSTLINRIAGVEYVLKEGDDINAYLEPKLGYRNIAFVGHERTSQTLYPHSVLIPGFPDHQDTAGIGDNRTHAESTMAALSIPLAIRNKKVRAIVLVIAWDQIKRDAPVRTAAFQELKKALFNILQFNKNDDITKILKATPIIFIISKPTTINSTFKPELFHKKSVEFLCQIRDLYEENYFEEKKRIEEVKSKFEQEVREIRQCKAEISVLVEPTYPLIAKIANVLLGTDKKLVAGAWAEQVETFYKILEEKKSSVGVIKRIRDFLGILSTSEDKLNKINQQISEWDMLINENLNKAKEQAEKIDSLEKEFQIAKIVPTSADKTNQKTLSERLFVIRCLDDLDELEGYKNYIKKSVKDNKFVDRSLFKFDLLSDTFGGVLEWGHGMAREFHSFSEDILNLPKEKIKIENDLEENNKLIISEFEKLQDTLKDPADPEQIEEIRKGYQKRIDENIMKLSKFSKRKEELDKEYKKNNDRLSSINSDKLVEYCSKIQEFKVVDVSVGGIVQGIRQWFNSWIGWHIYYGESPEIDVPIQKIEYSTCYDEKGQLIFKTPKTKERFNCNEFLNCTFDETVTCEHEGNNRYKITSGISTGSFIFSEKEIKTSSETYTQIYLANSRAEPGKCLAIFQEDNYQNVAFGIRFFVHKRDIPSIKEEIIILQNEIFKIQNELESLYENLKKCEEEINEYKLYIKSMLEGITIAQQSRVDKIISSLNKLEISFQEALFRNPIYSEHVLEKHLSYLYTCNETFLKELLIPWCWNNMQKYKQFSEERIMIFMGTTDKKFAKKERILTAPPEGFLNAILFLFEKTGMNILFLHTLLKSIDKNKKSLNNTLLARQKFLTDLLNDNMIEFARAKSKYQREEKNIATFNMVFEYFDDQIKKSVNARMEIREIKRVSDELKEIKNNEQSYFTGHQTLIVKNQHFDANDNNYQLVAPTPEENKMIFNAFHKNPTHKHDIASISRVENPALIHVFEAKKQALQKRVGNNYYTNWTIKKRANHEKNEIQQDYIMRYVHSAASYFADTSCPNVNCLLTFHGTSAENVVVNSILTNGFTASGQTDSHDPKQLQKVGFYGKGIYSTTEFNYAWDVYAKERGYIFGCCVTWKNAYPVIDLSFTGSNAYLTYDAHVVWVSSKLNYQPTPLGGLPDNLEVVVFQENQILPAFLIKMQPRDPKRIALNSHEYKFHAGMRAYKNNQHFYAYCLFRDAEKEGSVDATKKIEALNLAPAFKNITYKKR